MLNPLFETSPVSSVILPGIPGGISLKGLIVVVGPNSSGKTNLLRDIHAAASGSSRNLVVAQEIQLRSSAPFNDYLEFLQQTGDLERLPDPNNENYRKRGHQYGTQAGAGGQWTRRDIESWHGRMAGYTSRPLKGVIPANDFLAQIGLLECSALFIQQRLALTDSVGSFDTHQVPPTVALQALRLNKTAMRKFTAEIGRVFQRGAWLDVSGGGTLAIRVSDSNAPSHEDRIFPEDVKSYRTIETEGEGIRSYAAVCIMLLLAQRALYLIDEPEMCLHPPQARAIGRFIGEHEKTVKGCILVATHSSPVLRGVLETNQNVIVIRLTRNKGSFNGSQVSQDLLIKATRKPFSRSEIILDGLFADGVVLCESDGDRVVYESTLNTLIPPLPDIRFTPVGGIGGFAEPVRLYRSLEVPVAIAADLDFLFKNELREVLLELGATADVIEALSERISKILQEIRKLQPELSPDIAAKELKELIGDPRTWDMQKEAELRSKLNRLSGRLNRLALVKLKGIEGLPEPLSGELKSLLEDIQRYGLFLVPRGELESWVPGLMEGTSKENKSRWATEAARKVEVNEQGDDDVWEFVGSITAFLNAALKRNSV